MPVGVKLRYFLLKPTKDAKTNYRVACYYYLPDTKKRVYVPFSDERVDSILSRFRGGEIDLHTTELLLKELIAILNIKGGGSRAALLASALSEEHSKLLESFWAAKYGHKLLVDERSAYTDFERALRLISPVSLYLATSQEIQAALKKNANSTNQHRRAISRLKELLKFLGRTSVHLAKPEEEIEEVTYLTESEVFQLAEHAPNEVFKLATIMFFGTGCRYGEGIALSSSSLVGDRTLSVVKQHTRGKTKKPKRGKVGKIVVISSAWEATERWLSLDKSTFDRWQYYKWITSKCVELWPKQPQKHLSPHGLRHSHAIHLLLKGATMSFVARNLRNRVEICEKYYTGYSHQDESLEILKGIV